MIQFWVQHGFIFGSEKLPKSRLGGLAGRLGGVLERLGRFFGLLGSVLWHLGGVMSRLEAVLGPLGGVLARPDSVACGVLGGGRQKMASDARACKM